MDKREECYSQFHLNSAEIGHHSLAVRNENLTFHLQIVTSRKKCRVSKKLTISRARSEIEASKDIIGAPCVFELTNINVKLQKL